MEVEKLKKDKRLMTGQSELYTLQRELARNCWRDLLIFLYCKRMWRLSSFLGLRAVNFGRPENKGFD